MFLRLPGLEKASLQQLVGFTMSASSKETSFGARVPGWYGSFSFPSFPCAAVCVLSNELVGIHVHSNVLNGKGTS